MNENWTHKRTIADGETYEINGLNIWDYRWENTGDKITVKDPLYGQEYRFNIYTIQAEGRSACFAAGEFSNTVWGVYEKN